jgi:glycosyltransferase involved in cell wall biosynthesis
MSTVTVSVCLCTWNRATSLLRTLESLAQVLVPEGITWEVLVVDNNCTDETPQVLEQFVGHLPLQVVKEPRQGLSHARNTAIRESQGGLIFFVDDDVRVSKQWLAAYAAAVATHPEAAFFGGPIEPLFLEPPPAWFTPEIADRLATVIICRNDGPRDFEIREPRFFAWGANMGFRRQAFKRRGFDARLGVSGKSLLRGEETDLMQQLLTEGCHGLYVADARVQHEVPPHRLRLPYLLRYAWSDGRTIVLSQPGSQGGLWRDHRWRLGALLKACGGALLEGIRGRRGQAICRLMSVSRLAGGLWEGWREHTNSACDT